VKKSFNEVRAEVGGTIVRFLIDNEEPNGRPAFSGAWLNAGGTQTSDCK
jgi:hypothetical protein